jgi:hypothetical protein
MTAPSHAIRPHVLLAPLALLLAALAIATAPRQAHAQRRADLAPQMARRPSGPDMSTAVVARSPLASLVRDTVAGARERVPEMALGGLLGAVIGAGIGGVVGYKLVDESASGGDDWIPVGAILGAGVGEIVGMGAGVHLGNRGAGSASQTLLVSAGSGILAAFAAGWLANQVSLNEQGAIIALAVPAVQLFATVQMQRASARRRATHAR